jgi:hypothetical protein
MGLVLELPVGTRLIALDPGSMGMVGVHRGDVITVKGTEDFQWYDVEVRDHDVNFGISTRWFKEKWIAIETSDLQPPPFNRRRETWD